MDGIRGRTKGDSLLTSNMGYFSTRQRQIGSQVRIGTEDNKTSSDLRVTSHGVVGLPGEFYKFGVGGVAEIHSEGQVTVIRLCPQTDKRCSCPNFLQALLWWLDSARTRGHLRLFVLLEAFSFHLSLLLRRYFVVQSGKEHRRTCNAEAWGLPINMPCRDRPGQIDWQPGETLGPAERRRRWPAMRRHSILHFDRRKGYEGRRCRRPLATERCWSKDAGAGGTPARQATTAVYYYAPIEDIINALEAFLSIRMTFGFPFWAPS